MARVRVAVWLGYGPERPQFSRVGVAVWLVCGPERLQFSRAVWLGHGPERCQFSRVWLGRPRAASVFSSRRGGPGSVGESGRRHLAVFCGKYLFGARAGVWYGKGYTGK